ncbi:hypothetical protein PQQ36_13915, partial [Vibrio sp. CCUG 15886]|uniref:hypothetical protein n=1 Tax=Vibrio sp. CCUG 15886 TaxID=3025223 RepID=UPI0023597A72
GVAPIGRAADSKSACWEFESLHPCHLSFRGIESLNLGWDFFVSSVMKNQRFQIAYLFPLENPIRTALYSFPNSSSGSYPVFSFKLRGERYSYKLRLRKPRLNIANEHLS